MTRRAVVGLRSTGEIGLFISEVGHDAFSAAEANLIFSIQRSHSFLVGAGFVQLNAGGVPSAFVPFIHDYGIVPMVFCGGFNPRPTTAIVQVYATTSGFNAYPKQLFDGSYPAAGSVVPYWAWLKAA